MAKRKMSRAARKAISARMKAYWSERSSVNSPKKRAIRTSSRRVAQKGHTNGSGLKADRHLVTVYYRDQGILTREQHSIDTWGQLFDILTMQYLGLPIEEVRIDCNSLQAAHTPETVHETPSAERDLATIVEDARA